jgi:hypothetical protein
MKFAWRKCEIKSGWFRLLTGPAGFFFLVALFGASAPRSFAQQLTPVWIQLGENGVVIAKVIVPAEAKCPAIEIGNKKLDMAQRLPIPRGFPPLCEAVIPRNVHSASVNGQALALPKPDPSVVTVFGDTGCRINATQVQDCNDPAQWPFKQVAASAAAEKPSLMIHVGDYLYRELPCPAGAEKFCGDTPSGDNWATWNADFFAPAAKLLAATPWAFARGNHESCARSWRGWFYYLDPRPWDGKCQPFSPPYTIKMGSFQLAMLDSSEVLEDSLDQNQISHYSAQLASLRVKNAWLVAHHPFWGFKAGPLGKPSIAVSVPLEEAWNSAAPKGVSLVLSGHIHLFELITLDRSRPPQIVAGGGGTNLGAPILNASLHGAQVRGSSVVGSETEHLFGYTLLKKEGKTWHLTLKNQIEDVIFSCSFGKRIATASASPQSRSGARECGGS